jgi:hypothetical protein
MKSGWRFHHGGGDQALLKEDGRISRPVSILIPELEFTRCFITGVIEIVRKFDWPWKVDF